MPRRYTYTIQLIPAAEGGHVVRVPALPGCFTQGETKKEALAMAREHVSRKRSGVSHGSRKADALCERRLEKPYVSATCSTLQPERAELAW